MEAFMAKNANLDFEAVGCFLSSGLHNRLICSFFPQMEDHCCRACYRNIKLSLDVYCINVVDLLPKLEFERALAVYEMLLLLELSIFQLRVVVISTV